MKKDIEPYIKDIPDFPKKGIVFKDISPLLASAKARKTTTQLLSQPFIDSNIDVVVGIESRGFLFGMLLADALDAKFVMMRKPGKLPGNIITQQYELEYGVDALEIQENIITTNEKVLIHDDVLATGGTAAAAAIELLDKVGAQVVGFSFILELDFLKGRKKLRAQRVESIF